MNVTLSSHQWPLVHLSSDHPDLGTLYRAALPRRFIIGEKEE